jgi:hypothetical protein
MKKILFTAALATLALAGSALAAPKIDGKIDSGEYANKFTGKDVKVTVNYTIDGDTIYFGVESETEGWTGLGWNPTGSKKDGADMLMWFFKGGKLTFADMKMERATGAPEMDDEAGGKESITDAKGTATGKKQVVEFSRKLDTGDAKADVAIKKGANVFLLAIGDDASFTNRHSRSDREEVKATLK